jgi:hypothetical protein
VDDLAELTGDDFDVPVRAWDKDVHHVVPAIRAAMRDAPFGSPWEPTTPSVERAPSADRGSLWAYPACAHSTSRRRWQPQGGVGESSGRSADPIRAANSTHSGSMTDAANRGTDSPGDHQDFSIP